MKKILFLAISMFFLLNYSFGQFLPDNKVYCYPDRDIYIELNPNYSYIVDSIRWYDQYHSLLGSGVTAIEFSEGGFVYVEGYLTDNTYFTDSVWVWADRCNYLYFNSYIDNQILTPDTNYICLNGNDLNLHIDIYYDLPSYECYALDSINVYITLNDESFTYYSTNGNTALDINLPVNYNGVYLLTVEIELLNGCTRTEKYFLKIGKNLNVQTYGSLITSTEDSVILDVDPNNPDAFVTFTPQDYVEKSFLTYLIDNAFVELDTVYIPLIVDLPFNLGLNLPSGLNFSFAGNLYILSNVDKIYLLSPQSDTIFLFDKNYYYIQDMMIGEPIIDTYMEDIYGGSSKNYFFNNKSIDFFTSHYYQTNNYYRDPLTVIDNYPPDNTSYKIALPGFFSYVHSSVNTGTTIVNGTWYFIVEGNQYGFLHGYFRDFTFQFPTEYFIRPDFPNIYWVVNEKDTLNAKTLRLPNKPADIQLILTYNDNQCSEKYDFKIAPNEILENPQNVITPNGDGYNDKWEVITYLPPDTFIRIFDKNGRLIGKFSAKQFPTGWDGTINGTLLPKGIYNYIILFEDDRTVKGQIAILY